jgi:CubicO group peptidase (beta-lactamase class C family)
LLSSVVPGSSWASQSELTTAEPREVGLDENILNDLAARIRSNPTINIHSILIVKDNKLAFESYFSGTDQALRARPLGVVEFDKDTLHDQRSVTKSVTSALVGIAISEGRIPGVDANAHELFPEYSEQMAPDKRSITLHHILTMSAGLDWVDVFDPRNPGNDESRMSNSSDPVVFTLGRSLESKPGEHFNYSGGLPTLLGYLLERAYGKRGDEIVKEKLFDPLGIDGFEFHAMPSGFLAYAYGLRLTPRDMAKIGMLYVNKGQWREKQIIPSEWVEASLEPHAELSRNPPLLGYGYQFWLMRFESQENSIWVPHARGNGGQRIFILRPLNMVVVITAGDYDMRSREGELSSDQVLIDYIFPAAGMTDVTFISDGR